MRISSGFFKWCQIANALSHNAGKTGGKTGTDGLTPVANVRGYSVCPVDGRNFRIAGRRPVHTQCSEKDSLTGHRPANETAYTVLMTTSVRSSC